VAWMNIDGARRWAATWWKGTREPLGVTVDGLAQRTTVTGVDVYDGLLKPGAGICYAPSS
jgi:hypothetical protein